MGALNGYPNGAVSSSYTPPATTTDQAAMATLAYYNNQELDITAVSPDGTAVSKIFTTLMVLGKRLAGGEFDDVGLADMITENYPEYKFLEEDQINRVYQINGAIANGTATSFILDDTTGLQRGDLLRVTSTSEIVRIDVVVSATTLTVRRGVATYNAQAGQAIADNAILVLIGNAGSIGEAGRISFSTQRVERSNFLQKIQTSFTVKDGDVFSGKYGRNKAMAMKAFIHTHYLEHLKDLEMAALLGQKATGTDSVTGDKWYTTEGLLNTLLRGWVGDISGSLTVETLTKEWGKTLQYGGSTKVVFMGSDVLSKIRSLFTGYINVQNIETVNLKISTLELNGGTFILTTHPYMDANNGLNKIAIVCDPTTFKPVYPSGTDGEGVKKIGKTTMYKVEDKSNYAKEVGEWVTTVGFKNANALAGGVFQIVA